MKYFKSIIIFIFIISSCKYTFTKEQYLTNYASFMEDLKQNYKNYDEEKWKKQDKEFVKYNDELFLQFKDKLTPLEQARIIRFDFVYNLLRGKITFADFASGKYNRIFSAYLTELKLIFNEMTLLKKDIKDVISLELLNKILTTHDSLSSHK